MDWSKAKTILIVAFIITNMLLGVVLLSNNDATDSTTKQGFVQDVTRLLNNKDIHIDTEISRETPSLNTLDVEYEMIDILKINDNFFQGVGLMESQGEDMVTIWKDDEYISIKNKKILSYENRNELEKHKGLTKEKVEDIAMNFLRDKKYDISDIRLSYIREEEDNFYLEFSKTYNERYLETAYLNIVIDSRGVKYLDRVWLNVKSEGETSIYINTAPKAILSLLSIPESYGKTIEDISLCYYFDPEKHEYIKDPKSARKGRTIPAWRVLFKDGYKVIIDNY